MKNLHYNVSKFLILLTIHALFALFIYTITIKIIILAFPQKEFSYIIIFFVHYFFCFTFFLLMWKDLYYYNYHYFLKYNKKIVIAKNLLYSNLFILSNILLIKFFDAIFTFNSSMYSYFTEIIICLVIDSCSFILLHIIQFFWVNYIIKQGYLQQNVLIVGEADKCFPIPSLFKRTASSKIYVGNLVIKQSKWYFKDTDNQEKIILNSNILELLYKLQISELIIFISKGLTKKKIYKLIHYCRKNSIGYYLVPSVNILPRINFWLESFPYIPVIERYTTNRDSLTFISCKRIIDIILVTLSSIILLPVCLIIAVIIKIGDGGPVFYTSTRVGKDEKIIKFYKFRTMVINANKLKNNLLKYNERKDGPLFKMKNDPRVTKVGKILRRYSLDELPQLINVLKGNMSLVGPRPHLISEVSTYTYKDVLRLECIPGITCYPQILGRNTISFRKWVDLDLHYRKNWSLLLDLKILTESIKVVIKTSA